MILYKTVTGDTVSSLATKFGVPAQVITNLNKLGTTLPVGVTLAIPRPKFLGVRSSAPTLPMKGDQYLTTTGIRYEWDGNKWARKGWMASF